jgi:hypothetical protein
MFDILLSILDIPEVIVAKLGIKNILDLRIIELIIHKSINNSE